MVGYRILSAAGRGCCRARHLCRDAILLNLCCDLVVYLVALELRTSLAGGVEHRLELRPGKRDALVVVSREWDSPLLLGFEVLPSCASAEGQGVCFSVVVTSLAVHCLLRC